MPIGITSDGSQQLTPTATPVGSSTAYPNSSTTTSLSRSSSSPTLEESSDELKRRSTRLKKSNPKYANDIYDTCQFALNVADLISFKEVAKKEEW